jgi:hypothetical protein
VIAGKDYRNTAAPLFVCSSAVDKWAGKENTNGPEILARSLEAVQLKHRRQRVALMPRRQLRVSREMSDLLRGAKETWGH